MSIPTTCIIGDIHGCLTSLNALLEQVEDRAESFIFLGDYIDRGPDSKQVIERILQFKAEHRQVITLMGNHEFMLLNYLKGYDDPVFLNVGGRQTLDSYDVPLNSVQTDAWLYIPESHQDFFNRLPLHWEDRHAIYVHAGLEPDIHLSLQSSQCCLWVREDFIRCSYKFGKPVVFGHTVFKKPLIQKNKIGIDTGAVYGQQLTALLLPEKEFISVPGEQEFPYLLS